LAAIGAFLIVSINTTGSASSGSGPSLWNCKRQGALSKAWAKLQQRLVPTGAIANTCPERVPESD